MLCKYPKPTRLQTRFTASDLTLGILALLCWASISPRVAYAAELELGRAGESRGGSDHNWHRIQQDEPLSDAFEDGYASPGARGYEAVLSTRDDARDIDANDSPNSRTVAPGQTDLWKYGRTLLMGPHTQRGPGLPSNLSDEKRSADFVHLDLKRSEVDEDDTSFEIVKRQADSRTMYVSMNVCKQPTWSGGSAQKEAPPQLTLYIGQPDNQSPGPGSSGRQQAITLTEGFVSQRMTSSTDVYLSVSAPQLPAGFTGQWDYNIAVSIDAPYHSVNTSSPFLYLIDTDSTSAVLVTDNLTQAHDRDPIYSRWMNLTSPLPFVLFANNASDSRRMGLTYSYCGLQQLALVQGRQNDSEGRNTGVNMSMVNHGLGNKPKQRFVISNLANSSLYNASLAMPGNGRTAGKGVVGGGGTVWLPTNWTTKSDGNCQLMYDLPFCDEVVYAVPSNPRTYPTRDALASVYDDYASALFRNFTLSLQLIQCNAVNESRYSLSKNCKDCSRAYKQWLCAVTLPRCEDFSNKADYLQPRNVGQAFFYDNATMLSDDVLNTSFRPMEGAPTLPGSPIDQTYRWSAATNQSRNPTIIDKKIMPGPYKEVLPCEDLCYGLIQSCPAALQFACPLPGRGLEVDYGKRPKSNSIVQCSFLGALYYVDAAGSLAPSMLMALSLALMTTFLLIL